MIISGWFKWGMMFSRIIDHDRTHRTHTWIRMWVNSGARTVCWVSEVRCPASVWLLWLRCAGVSAAWTELSVFQAAMCRVHWSAGALTRGAWNATRGTNHCQWTRCWETLLRCPEKSSEDWWRMRGFLAWRTPAPSQPLASWGWKIYI